MPSVDPPPVLEVDEELEPQPAPNAARNAISSPAMSQADRAALRLALGSFILRPPSFFHHECRPHGLLAIRPLPAVHRARVPQPMRSRGSGGRPRARHLL